MCLRADSPLVPYSHLIHLANIVTIACNLLYMIRTELDVMVSYHHIAEPVVDLLLYRSVLFTLPLLLSLHNGPLLALRARQLTMLPCDFRQAVTTQ
jgi:uncharacterized membrane protein